MWHGTIHSLLWPVACAAALAGCSATTSTQIALDAAAAEPFVAVSVAAVVAIISVVRRQPELRAGTECRPAIEPGVERRAVVRPGVEWRTTSRARAAGGVALPVRDEAGRLERYDRQPREYGRPGQYLGRPAGKHWLQRPAREHVGRSGGKHGVEPPAGKHRRRPAGRQRSGVHLGFERCEPGLVVVAWFAVIHSGPRLAGIGGGLVDRVRGRDPDGGRLGRRGPAPAAGLSPARIAGHRSIAGSTRRSRSSTSACARSRRQFRRSARPAARVRTLTARASPPAPVRNADGIGRRQGIGRAGGRRGHWLRTGIGRRRWNRRTR